MSFLIINQVLADSDSVFFSYTNSPSCGLVVVIVALILIAIVWTRRTETPEQRQNSKLQSLFALPIILGSGIVAMLYTSAQLNASQNSAVLEYSHRSLGTLFREHVRRINIADIKSMRVRAYSHQAMRNGSSVGDVTQSYQIQIDYGEQYVDLLTGLSEEPKETHAMAQTLLKFLNSHPARENKKVRFY